MKDSTYYKSLPVVLTPEEFETKSTELADICKDINLAKDQEKTRSKLAKEAIEKQEAQRSKLATTVHDKAEDRSVECADRYNLREKMVESYRMDNGEVFATRAMDLAEYQQEMDLHANPLVAFDKMKKSAEA